MLVLVPFRDLLRTELALDLLGPGLTVLAELLLIELRRVLVSDMPHALVFVAKRSLGVTEPTGPLSVFVTLFPVVVEVKPSCRISNATDSFFVASFKTGPFRILIYGPIRWQEVRFGHFDH